MKGFALGQAEPQVDQPFLEILIIRILLEQPHIVPLTEKSEKTVKARRTMLSAP
jgi:hypothetical protein